MIAPGETIAIIGANGAGKSSYLKAITGLIRAEPDSVRFEDEPIGALGAANILKLGIAHGAGGAAAVFLADGRGKPADRELRPKCRWDMVARQHLCAVPRC